MNVKRKKNKEMKWDDLKSISHQILEKMNKIGTKYTEIRLEKDAGESIYVSNGNIEAVSFGSEEGIGVRYLLDGYLGFFSINTFEKQNIDRIIEQSVISTKNSAKIGDKIEFSREKSERSRYGVKEKKKISDIGIDEKIEFVKDIERGLLDSKAKIFSSTFYYVDTLTNKYYLNSEGSIIESNIPRIDLFYSFTIKENGQSVQRHWQYGIAGGFEKIEKMRIDEKIKNEAIALKDNLLNGISPPKGEIEVILSPEISGIMAHESVGHPYEADRILGRESAQAGESFVTKDMLGMKIGNDIVNVADDP
ncbi:MAG: TldD/PmbA family protein, partial [Candidatus Micrarchaeia archaeon]